jgi:hypothetical protein
VRLRQQADIAGHADRPAAGKGLGEGQGLAVRPQPQAGRVGGGGGFAAVDRLDLAGPAVIMDQEAAATDAAMAMMLALTVVEPQSSGIGGGGGGFAAVDRLDLTGPPVIMDQEAAAADAGGLRLDHGQRQHHRHGGIGGGAALAQDVLPRLGRARIGGGDDAARDRGLLGGGRGLDGKRRGQRGGEQQGLHRSGP